MPDGDIMSECRAKHAVPDVPLDDWKCPKCGARHDSQNGRAFVLETPALLSDTLCRLLHEDDELRCDCGMALSGKEFSEIYAKKIGVVPCPNCKGCGVVPKPSRRTTGKKAVKAKRGKNAKR